MSEASTREGRLIMNPDRFFIGGEWVSPSSEARIAVVTPSTENIFMHVAEAQAADVERAIAAAREAFDNGPWPRLSHAERAGYLREISKQIAARPDIFAQLWSSEVGALRSAGGVLAQSSSGVFQEYATLAESFQFEERHVPRGGGNVGLLVHEPVGVVAAIIPWNGPLMIMTYKIVPALLAGCAVIVKASPEAPGAAYVMAEIMAAVGLPKGVFNVLTADREVSELLVRHPGVDKVTFTGSGSAGQKIASICGQRIARCTLELGGKSAAVVLQDCDVSAVVAAMQIPAQMLCGQVCSALTRVVVTRDRHDEVLDAITAAFAGLRVGDPFDPATDIGPLAMARQRERVELYITRGKAEGARITTGGGRPSHLDRGYFIEPTVFGNVTNDMVIAREEIFGPVVSVIPADSEEQAIAIANDSPFGLNASVFTRDPDRAYRVARQLRSGTVGHNAFRTDFSIAFGGFKQSGIGREGGVEGLRAFLEPKTVILDGMPAHLRA